MEDYYALAGVFASTLVNSASGLIQGNWQQFGVQVLAVVITTVYAFAVTYLILRVLNVFEPVRVSEASSA